MTFDAPEGERSPAMIRELEVRSVRGSMSSAFPEWFRGREVWLPAADGDETGTVELDTVANGLKLRDEAVVAVECDGNEAAEWRKIDGVCRRREGRRVTMYL